MGLPNRDLVEKLLKLGSIVLCIAAVLLSSVSCSQLASSTGVKTTSSTATSAVTSPQSKTTSPTVKASSTGTTGLRVTIPADGNNAAVSEGGEYPKDYTCQGTSSAPPLEWSGVPSGTKSLAIIMWTVPPAPDPIKSYWIIYNISPAINGLARNQGKNMASLGSVGVLGLNEKNARAYEPTCSAGPGAKTYSITIYALSAEPVIENPAKVYRDTLLTAMKDITIDSFTLNFSSSYGNLGVQGGGGGAAPPPPK